MAAQVGTDTRERRPSQCHADARGLSAAPGMIHDVAYAPITAALVTAWTSPTRFSRGPVTDHSAHPVHAVGPAARRPMPISFRADGAESAPPTRSHSART